MVLCVSSRMTEAQQSVADIGSITELNGLGRVVRDRDYEAELAFSINSYDNVQTAKGRVAITFVDDSKVRLTEHSKLLIDEFIYDANPSNSKMALQFASGTARFISGGLSRINKENISIKTPTATIGIRGTDFTVTVDELGRSLVILLPDENGLSSGEVIVSSALGQVTLNQPYQATTVSMFEATPSSPVILDITLELIDNMLIVNPPDEQNIEGSEATTGSSDNLLDVDYLEFNELEVDALEEDELEYTELDINYLDVNFLEDLLDIIEDVDELDKSKSGLTTDTAIKGTAVGFDPNTQINTFVTDNDVTFLRQVSDTSRINLDKSGSSTVVLEQDGKRTPLSVNGGTSSTITIKQGG